MIAHFYDLPLGSLAALTAIFCVGFAWFGVIFLRPFLRLFVRAGGKENDVIGYVLSSFGVLYGILLGLTAVAAYQNWSTVDANVTKEASALISTYQAISTFPEPDRQDLRALLIDLSKFELEDEWPMLRKGQVVSGGRAKTDEIEARIMAFVPETKALEHVHERSIDLFSTFVDQRRLRLYSAGSGIPPILWYVVFVGALINMILVWLLESRLMTQLLLGGLLAVFLGAMILLIAVMAKPFQTRPGVAPDALVAAQQFMMKG